MSAITYTRQQADVAQKALTQLIDVLSGAGLTIDDLIAFGKAGDVVAAVRDEEPATKAEELAIATEFVEAQRVMMLDDYRDTINFEIEQVASWLPLLVDPTL